MIRRTINEILLLLPFPILILCNVEALISIVKNPWGHTTLRFIVWQQDFHSLTVVYLTIFYLTLFFYFYSELRPLYRITFSSILPLFGLFFHEFWWHLGCQIALGGGLPMFWGLYTIAVGVGIYILHINYGILVNFSEFLHGSRSVWVVGLLFAFVGGMRGLLEDGFYQDLLQYDLGRGPDPHGFPTALVKGIGILMWLCVAGKVRKQENGEMKNEE